MFGLTLIASLYYYAINCCHALLKRPKRASSLPEQPQRPEELVALMLGVTAQMALQLCCQPCWQCLCPQDSVLSSHGVFFSAGFQSFKNHIENIRHREEDWFSLLSYLSYLSQERELEKTASTILVAFLWLLSMHISKGGSVLWKIHISFKLQMVVLLFFHRSEHSYQNYKE